MAFTTDTDTDLGKVRVYNGDVDSANPIFDDAQTGVFISQESTLKRAAASSLEAMAANRAYLARAIKSLNFSEDDRGVAKALIDAAAKLRASESEEPCEGVAEWGVTSFAFRDLIINDALR